MNKLKWEEEIFGFEKHEIEEFELEKIKQNMTKFSKKDLIELLLTNAKLKKGSILLSQFEKITVKQSETAFEERVENLKNMINNLETNCKILNLNYICFLKSFNGTEINVENTKKGLHAVFLCTNNRESNIKEYANQFQKIFENPQNQKIQEEYDECRRKFLGIPHSENYYGNALIKAPLSKEEKTLLRTYYDKEIPKNEKLLRQSVEKCIGRHNYIKNINI